MVVYNSIMWVWSIISLANGLMAIPLELLQIEATFLKACGYELPFHHANANYRPENPRDTERLFNGLSEVIKYLCELDNIKNVMDYSKLFEQENKLPKYAIEF